eukprot:NODE_2071_length_1306_cov_28.498807_g1884_i0.p1 GENE.NODE_2071_length_1306_cov_28.498807_g1884_i0~~NODE_2071_length_1306_cov_28.498807_g1884_i0.p1  ORF type:complete len:308 (+),score=31.55 NODE_2071_length_1306_cov_28.498807_g1884_i0:155-1078(+)
MVYWGLPSMAGLLLTTLLSTAQCLHSGRRLSRGFVIDKDSQERPALSDSQLQDIFLSHSGFVSEDELQEAWNEAHRDQSASTIAASPTSPSVVTSAAAPAKRTLPIGYSGRWLLAPLEASPQFAQILYADGHVFRTVVDALAGVRLWDSLPPYLETGLPATEAATRTELEILLLHINVFSGSALPLWLKLGHCWRNVGNSAKAIHSYRHALAIAPTDLVALQGIAIVLVHHGYLADAGLALHVILNPAMSRRGLSRFWLMQPLAIVRRLRPFVKLLTIRIFGCTASSMMPPGGHLLSVPMIQKGRPF